MFFCSRLPEEDAVRAREAGREKLLQLLISDMHCAFPDLTFELRLNFRIINAQALRLPGKRIVILYGGLALHPDLAANSLALILLHEAGHHSASGCRLSCDPSLACECAADHWAATSGAETLLQRSGRQLSLEAAISELRRVIMPRQSGGDKYTKKTAASVCWAADWELRSRALLKRSRPPSALRRC
jgi:hypothetical protein